MDIRQIVNEDFQEFILMDPSVPNDLRDSLRVKERSPLFINNLVGQIHEVIRVKPHIKLDRMKIKNLVYDMTKMFVHLLKVKADEMIASEAEKSRIKASIEGDEISQMLDDHGNADLTEQLGVIIKDKE